MIQSACLLIVAVAVAFRARRSYAKPAWWATLFALISLATYGIVGANPRTLDGLLGGHNLLTLVRDATAVAAMWFFHNSVAVQRGRPDRKFPLWNLPAAIAAFAIPFALIDGPGTTSTRFVLDRLDQVAVWAFASIYTAIVGVIAALTIRLLSTTTTIPTVLYVVGLSLMLVSDVLELLYLAITHFGDVSMAVREQFYYVAELPFFSGILIAVLGFIWILGTRAFWWSVSRWTLRIDARVQPDGFRQKRLALAKARAWSNRQLAFDSAANVRDRVKVGLQQLSPTDLVIFGLIERRLSIRLEEATP